MLKPIYMNWKRASRSFLIPGIAIFVVMSLVLAACGSDDGGRSSSDADNNEPITSSAGGNRPLFIDGQATPTTPPDVAPTEAVGQNPAGSGEFTGEPIKVGVIQPFTGGLGDWGIPHFQAAQIAADEINAAGGVLGRELVLIEMDSGTNPDTAVEAAKQLAEEEGVVAIFGAAGSSVSIAIASEVSSQLGILQISAGSTSPALSTLEDNDFFFRTALSDAAQGIILSDIAHEQGYDSACVLYIDNAYGIGLAEVFVDAFEAAGGSVTGNFIHPEALADPAPIVPACVETNPDVIVVVSYQDVAEEFLNAGGDVGDIPFLFTDGLKSRDFFEKVGAENYENMLGTSPGLFQTGSFIISAGQQFDASYQARHGEISPVPFTREAYDTIYLIALAAQAAGSDDPAAMRDALRDLANAPGVTVTPGNWANLVDLLAQGQDIEFQGASGPVDFDVNGDIERGAVEIWQLSGGQPVIVETREVDLSTP